MAAIVIDKFCCVYFSYCPANGRHFAYTLKEIDDALKDSPLRLRIPLRIRLRLRQELDSELG